MVATLAKPNLPLYLYRYRSVSPRENANGLIQPTITREIEALTEPYIWCADFHSLNDPMEGFYRPSSNLRRDDDYDSIVQEVYERKIEVGIASFSDTKENELMWTHYAGNYAGICIEYYAKHLLGALPDRVELVRMGYDDLPPRISMQEVDGRHAGARKIFSQKKYNWAYEREWRVLGSVGKVEIESTQVVRSIYLGSRIRYEHRSAILEALKNSAVAIYEMQIDGYAHVWSPIQGPKNERR